MCKFQYQKSKLFQFSVLGCYILSACSVKNSQTKDCKNDLIPNYVEIQINTPANPFNGIDIEALIKDPTSEEIKQASEEINNRDRSVRSLEVVDTFKLFVGGQKADLKIISHLIDGNKHYGGIVIPQHKPQEKLPVLVYLDGFNQQLPYVWINQNDQIFNQLSIDHWKNFIIVIPSFRGQTLSFNKSDNTKIIYKSEGDRADAFDGAAEDALGLLNATLASVDNADANRIFTMGYSRGGTVALLMAERDSRIKWVLNTAGALDFIGRTLFERTFDHQLLMDGLNSNSEMPNNLGEQYVYFFLKDINRKAVPYLELRKKITQSSPHYFAADLRSTQIQMHYGEKDISYIQLQRFNEQMTRIGNSCPQYESFTYPNREHDLIGDKPVEEMINEFLHRFVKSNAH